MFRIDQVLLLILRNKHSNEYYKFQETNSKTSLGCPICHLVGLFDSIMFD